MATTRSVEAEARNKKVGMRLDELEAFLRDAQLAGATGDEVVEVTTVGLIKPRIKTATVRTKQPMTSGTD